MSTRKTETRTFARCLECGNEHEVTFSHISEFGGHKVYASVCDADWLTDYVTEEIVYTKRVRVPDLSFLTF